MNLAEIINKLPQGYLHFSRLLVGPYGKKEWKWYCSIELTKDGDFTDHSNNDHVVAIGDSMEESATELLIKLNKK